MKAPEKKLKPGYGAKSTAPYKGRALTKKPAVKMVRLSKLT